MLTNTQKELIVLFVFRLGITPNRVEKLLGLSSRTIRNWQRSGDFCNTPFVNDLYGVDLRYEDQRERYLELKRFRDNCDIPHFITLPSDHFLNANKRGHKKGKNDAT